MKEKKILAPSSLVYVNLESGRKTFAGIFWDEANRSGGSCRKPPQECRGLHQFNFVEFIMHETEGPVNSLHVVSGDNDLGDLIHIHVDASVNPSEEDGYVAAVVHEGNGDYLAARSSKVKCLHDPILSRL
nr:hypothetical protein Iba_chr15aCG11000 [Ipomoea batatas]